MSVLSVIGGIIGVILFMGFLIIAAVVAQEAICRDCEHRCKCDNPNNHDDFVPPCKQNPDIFTTHSNSIL